MVSKELIKRFYKDRDAAVLSLNVEEFKKFCKKWNLMTPPTDKMIEIVMRKMAVHIETLPDDFRAECAEWLIVRKYSIDL